MFIYLVTIRNPKPAGFSNTITAFFDTPQAAIGYTRSLFPAQPLTYDERDESWAEHVLKTYPPGCSCAVENDRGVMLAQLSCRTVFRTEDTEDREKK